MTEPLLEVEDLDVRYGSSQALFGVSLAVRAGHRAGRPRRQRCRQEHARPCRLRAGAAERRAGRSSTGGTSPGMPAHRIRKLGLTYIPEGRGIFPGLSVIDNLRMAVAQETRGERAAAIDRAIERFPGARAAPQRSGPAACRGASSRCSPWPGRWPSRPSS